MDYKVNKEAVDKIIERVLDNGSTVINKNDLEEMFPELTELEDEGIRIELLNYLYDVHDDDEERARWIAWLEKQGEQMFDPRYSILDKLIEADDIYQMSVNDAMVEEAKNKAIEVLSKLEISKLLELEKQGEQKSVDNVEPKFNVNDWVIDSQGIVHQIGNVIENVTNHTYSYDIVGSGYFNDNTEGVRLWTIQDAKDGDVLANNGNIILFKQISDSARPDYKFIQSYCFVLTHRFDFYLSGTYNLDDGFHPATKEQRNLLFQKMTDAGYTFDFEKKELRKIEQKSSTSVNEFDIEVERFCKECFITDTNEKGNVFCIARHFTDWQKNRQKPVTWSGEVSAFKDKLLELFQKFRWKGTPTNGEILEYVNAHIQELIGTMQKPAWSEEDNRILSTLTKYLEEHGGGIDGWECSFLSKWFKSLKDRLQPKQEWSEEDKETKEWLIEYFKYRISNSNILEEKVNCKKALNLIESLHPQNRWKPSEEQIKAVKEAACYSSVFSGKTIDNLISLSKQLKKLMEE